MLYIKCVITDRKATHDFLSLYSPVQQDPRPPQGKLSFQFMQNIISIFYTELFRKNN